jgi:hypothetical protein
MCGARNTAVYKNVEAYVDPRHILHIENCLLLPM